MWKSFFSFFKMIEENRRARNILNQNLFDNYKQKCVKELVFPIVYEANKKLWNSGLPEQKIGEIFLNIGKIVRKHQREFSKEVEGVYADYKVLEKIKRAKPIRTIHFIQEIQNEQEIALKREVWELLDKMLYK